MESGTVVVPQTGEHGNRSSAKVAQCGAKVHFIMTHIGGERDWFFGHNTAAHRQTIIETARRFAADPDLNFTHEAADIVAERLGPRNRCTS